MKILNRPERQKIVLRDGQKKKKSGGGHAQNLKLSYRTYELKKNCPTGREIAFFRPIVLLDISKCILFIFYDEHPATQDLVDFLKF